MKQPQPKGEIYSSENSQPTEKTESEISIGLIILTAITVLLSLLNSLLLFTLDLNRTGSVDNAIGATIGGAHFFPLLTVAIASIWKSNRNIRSVTKIYFFWSLFILLYALSQWSKAFFSVL